MLRFLLARVKYDDPLVAISAANVVAFPGLLDCHSCSHPRLEFFQSNERQDEVDQSRHLSTRVEDALSASRNGNIDDNELFRRTALKFSSQYTNSHSLRPSFVFAV